VQDVQDFSNQAVARTVFTSWRSLKNNADEIAASSSLMVRLGRLEEAIASQEARLDTVEQRVDCLNVEGDILRGADDVNSKSNSNESSSGLEESNVDASTAECRCLECGGTLRLDLAAQHALECGAEYNSTAERAPDSNGLLLHAPRSETFSAPRRQRCCLQGHALHQYFTPTGGFVCDGCGTGHRPPSSSMFGCRACNFDLCLFCLRPNPEADHASAAAGEEVWAYVPHSPVAGREPISESDTPSSHFGVSSVSQMFSPPVASDGKASNNFNAYPELASGASAGADRTMPSPLLSPGTMPRPVFAPRGKWCRAVVVRAAKPNVDASAFGSGQTSRDDGNGGHQEESDESSRNAAAAARCDVAVLLHYLAEVHGPSERTV